MPSPAGAAARFIGASPIPEGSAPKFHHALRAKPFTGAIRYLLVGTALLGCLAMAALAQDRHGDLSQLSLEDLMNLQVTSVSKKEQKLSRTAAAVFVITQEDIRRSGATNIPDLLRMVPGLEVAQINSSTWAISARGFNKRFANKMLVLIDGRTVYTPLFSGTYWDAQDVLLEDIERIEVIRGPGGTVWGANAVNGVINIITKSADQTQGGLLTAGGGNQEAGFGAARYGGKIGSSGTYRFYAKGFKRNGSFNADGGGGDDGWNTIRGGFRSDWRISQRDSLTVQGDVYNGEETALIDEVTSFTPPFMQTFKDHTAFGGGNVLARWTRTTSERSDMALQAYFDRTSRTDILTGENRNTLDLDFHHHFAWGERQDIVWGLGYRFSADQLNETFALEAQDTRGDHLFSGFVQDEIALVPDRLFLTLGTKVEHNSYSGLEAEPNLRLLWNVHPRHALWFSVSRAVRTPNREEHTLQYNQQAFPGPGGLANVVTVLGNPAFGSEDLLAYEFGYRVQPSAKLSLDLAAFDNLYSNLQAVDQGVPFLSTDPLPHIVIPLTFSNEFKGSAHGVEAAATWKVRNGWTLSGGYSWLDENLKPTTGNADVFPTSHSGENPNHQFHLRSLLNLRRNIELDTAFYYVSALPALEIPHYTRLDARLGWHPLESLEVSVVAQNALHDKHEEFNAAEFGLREFDIRRSIFAKLTWRF